MRFVLLNDIHVEPDAPGSDRPRRAAEGFASTLATIQQLSPRPEFLVTGGDHIMDALEASAESAQAQWDLYEKTLRACNTLPVYALIGNHDVLGWMNAALSESTPGYGKAMAQRRLGLASPYYSFDRGGWHFIFLDNIQRKGAGYCGGVDEKQMAWLAEDLQRHGSKPTFVLSHIPLLSACAAHFLGPEAGVTFWQIPHVFVQTDSQPVVDLLARHNVRLVVSAHLHMCEKIDYRGITFICNGSLSANWWHGDFKGFPPGYGLFDLAPDGAFQYQYKMLETSF
jgi:hypothetical protein